MRELSKDEVMKCELGCLKSIHDYCQAHNLRYYLSFGTLIGAIRHKGFIPWDDDIDILMPRNDYNYFISNFTMPDHEVLAYENEPRCYAAYAKVTDTRTELEEKDKGFVIGAFVDVFPLDNLPNNKLRRLIFGGIIFLQRKIITAARVKPGKDWPFLKRTFTKIVKALYSEEKLKYYALGWKYPQKYKDQKDSQFHSLLFKSYRRIPILDAKWFQEQVLVDFEDEQFYVPCGYDAFLRRCYGDYMKLPPVELRYGHHNFTCHWKEGQEPERQS